MAVNQRGAVIPYQPTYSIQYKYGDRYGPQSFASPTTALGAGQTGGPLASQTTLDGTSVEGDGFDTNTIASGQGDGQTLGSDGSPGGSGGADFSQFREGYSPVQPDLGFLYADGYGSGIFAPPTTGFGYDSLTNPVDPVTTSNAILSTGDGGESSTSSGDPDAMGLETDLEAQIDVNYGLNTGGTYTPSKDLLDDIQDINDNTGSGTGFGSGTDLGGPTDAGYTSGTGGGAGTPGVDPSDPNSTSGIDGPGSGGGGVNPSDPNSNAGIDGPGSVSQNNNNNNNDSDNSSSGSGSSGNDGTDGGYGGENNSVDHGGFNMGGLIPFKKIPNPLLEDPLADLFRRV